MHAMNEHRPDRSRENDSRKNRIELGDDSGELDNQPPSASGDVNSTQRILGIAGIFLALLALGANLPNVSVGVQMGAKSASVGLLPDIHPIIRLIIAAAGMGLASIALVLNLGVAGIYQFSSRQADAGRQAAFFGSLDTLAMFGRSDMDSQDRRAHRTLWNDLTPEQRRQRLGEMLDYFTKQYGMALNEDCPFDVEKAKTWMMSASDKDLEPVQKVLFASRNSRLGRDFFFYAGKTLKSHFP